MDPLHPFLIQITIPESPHFNMATNPDGLYFPHFICSHISTHRVAHHSWAVPKAAHCFKACQEALGWLPQPSTHQVASPTGPRLYPAEISLQPKLSPQGAS